MRPTPVTTLVLCGLTACASLGDGTRTTSSRDPVSQWWQSVPTIGEGGETTGDLAAAPGGPLEWESPEPTSLRRLATGVVVSTSPLAERDPSSLALWSDPGFQRRFLESYVAETEIEPRVTIVEREHLQDALELMSDGKEDEALALMQKHGGPGASAVFDFMMANIYYQREQYDLAAAGYRTCVDKYPKFLRAWKNMGLIHVRDGAFEDAARALTRVVELGGADGLSYGLLGFSYASLGNHLSAETAYRMATLLDPDTGDWTIGLARSLFEQERFADAAALCKVLIAREPGRADLWLLQANAFLGLGQPMRAAENYELVDRLGGSSTESLSTLGDIYVNEGLFDLAVGAYGRAMALDGEGADGGDPSRALRAAKVLTARGALAQTRALVERLEQAYGMRLDEAQRKDVLKLRARIAVAEGAGDEEAAVLEEIVTLDPLDGEALILLGQHSSREGDVQQAIYYYERAASLEDFEADAKVRHAQLLVGQSRYDEALALLRRAQTLEPRQNVQDYLEQVERLAQ